MNNPERRVWLRSTLSLWDSRGGHKAVATATVGCKGFTRTITSLSMVQFKRLKCISGCDLEELSQWPSTTGHASTYSAFYFQLKGRLSWSPNISIAGEVGANRRSLPCKKNRSWGRSVEVCPVEGSFIGRNLGCSKKPFRYFIWMKGEEVGISIGRDKVDMRLLYRYGQRKTLEGNNDAGASSVNLPNRDECLRWGLACSGDPFC